MNVSESCHARLPPLLVSTSRQPSSFQWPCTNMHLEVNLTGVSDVMEACHGNHLCPQAFTQRKLFVLCCLYANLYACEVTYAYNDVERKVLERQLAWHLKDPII